MLFVGPLLYGYGIVIRIYTIVYSHLSCIPHPLLCTMQLGHLLKCPHQIPSQILPILQTNADPQQPPINRGIRHSPPLNQCLHAAQTCRVLQERKFARQSSCLVFFLHDDGEHRPEAVGHLFADEWLRLETGVVDRFEVRLDGSFVAVWGGAWCV